MPENMIDLSRLDTYKENNRIEAKKALGGLPHSLWETYSSFANTLGGIILLGVEEKKDKNFQVHDLPCPQRLVDEFWSIVSNPAYVSANILNKEQVQIVTLKGCRIITITVPRASRKNRPVYIGTDLYTGSYRRDGEGDYHCSREEVDAMVRDARRGQQEEPEWKDAGMEVFDYGTLARYRKYLGRVRPGHLWLELSDESFLEKLGAAGQGVNGEWYPTAAGLLMFGKEAEIVKRYPCYALDYQELQPDGIWVDLVISDTGDWSGNLFDFFSRVYQKIQKGIRVPGSKGQEKRQKGETPVHEAIREVLVNCLVNADYEGKQGVVVKKDGSKITFENPGSFGIDREQAVKGGVSDPRNPGLIKMFHLLGIGNGTGSGLAQTYALWKRQGFALPKIREEFHPERIQVSLRVEKAREGTRTAGKKLRQKRKEANQIIYESQKQLLIDYVTKARQVRTGEAAKLLDLSFSKTKGVLIQMVEEGILEQKGGNRNRFYQLKA